jgi:WD40 repeat protein
VQVWDAANGRTISTYPGHAYGVLSVAWSPDGRRIASGSWDTTVRVWNVSTGHSMLIYRGHTDSVLALAWSPDGTQIASASVYVCVWQAS